MTSASGCEVEVKAVFLEAVRREMAKMKLTERIKSERASDDGWTRKLALEEVKKAISEKEREKAWLSKMVELKELRRPK
jgi:hypothetical protein